MSEIPKQVYKLWHTPLLILILFAIYITSCSPEYPKEIKEFYYPVDELQEGLVYHYQSTINDEAQTDEYWFFKSHEIKEQLALTGQYYNANKAIEQYFRQQITSSGALLDEYRLYTKDTIVETIPVEILYNNVFPFSVRDSNAVYLYKLKYTNPADSSVNTIIRNRRYGGTTEWEHNGKTYDAIRINLLEQFQNDKNGVLTIDMRGYEIYAEGIGLVLTDRYTQDGGTHLVDRLIDRIPMEAFEITN